MATVILGAGVVGTATAWYLKQAGQDVILVERQSEAAMETSWGNGGIIHASEVEPWSQPGMPSKILKWLGKEDAPLLLRYSAIPHMFRWGMAFAQNCTPERFRANALANLHLALAIPNTTWFEVLLPDGAHRYGLAQEFRPDAKGMLHAPDGPGLGADIDFEMIKRKTEAVLQ